MTVKTTDRVLSYLLEHGPSGCSNVGSVIENRCNNRGGVSTNGGGDYAAQMLLGRMRKAGLVRTTHSPGSSLWELTRDGRARAMTYRPQDELKKTKTRKR